MTKVDKRTRMIAVADYMFSGPDKERTDVLAKFGKVWQTSSRTLDRVIKEAKEYNLKRVEEQERIKGDLLIAGTKESFSAAILSRSEALEALTKIAKGVGRKIGDEAIIPTDSDRIRAIQQISKMQGWDAPIKIDAPKKITISYTGINS